jgi:hypothetical protein
MSLLQLARVSVGEVGLLPGNVKMVSTANLGAVTTAGYLNGAGNQLSTINLSPSDIIEALYSFNAATGVGTFALFTVSITNGIITLAKYT